MPITFVQAAMGATIEIPTLEGTTPLKIPAGAQTGEVMRLRGKGIKRLNGSGFGDQLVRITIETPTRLSSKQKELLREFENEGSKNSQPGIDSFLKKFREIFKK